jgi:putative transposase
MKASKFSEAQIAFVLKQAEDGSAVAEVCRKAGISEATFYSWRKKYAGLMPSEMKRLRQLEEENGKLKRIVADLAPKFYPVLSSPLPLDLPCWAVGATGAGAEPSA